jgi:hypothetical protein
MAAWDDRTLLQGKYTLTSDLCCVGLMLAQWDEAAGHALSADGQSCLELLRSHQSTALDVAAHGWFDRARAKLTGRAT